MATSGTIIPESVITGCEVENGREKQRGKKLGGHGTA
jgi:hypothetical protein